MLFELKKQLQSFISDTLKSNFSDNTCLPEIELEVPANKEHGEFSTNIALKSAKILKKSPMQIAGDFVSVLEEALDNTELAPIVDKIEVKNPGFINFYLKSGAVLHVLPEIISQGNSYGRLGYGNKEKIQIEFVSANPTGPLSVAHARQAVVGDSLANILNYLGFDAAKEYYVNDEGNQINLLGVSIRCRAVELLGGEADFPEDGYHGEYIKDMADEFMKKNGIETLEKLKDVSDDAVRLFGVEYLMDVIRTDLNDFGVHFDIWAHQSKIAGTQQISDVLKFLDQKGFTKEEDGALWFKSTEFGDDKDRVLRKSDGAYTYLTPDIVYHKDKFERGFNRVFNIWGPDHHGYIPRIKASVQALGEDKDALEVLIVQLATIYRNGKAVSMSTRKGEFISLREVIDEVGVDAARYFFMMRHISVHLDFDLELAKKQTSENPVYYIQYAHARVNSINEKAEAEGLKPVKDHLHLLKEEEEIDLVKKLAGFQEVLLVCYKELDPFALVNYLQELAMCFHKFYDRHRVVDADQDLSGERLTLINAAQVVLRNGLTLLGINAPEKM